MNTTGESKTRIFLVEEECLVRAALRILLESWPECAVVGDAGSSTEALKALGRLDPDLVLLSLSRVDSQSLELVGGFVQASAPQVIALVGESLVPNAAAEIVRLGARGVVRKTTVPDELRRAIQKIHLGKEIWLDRASMANLVTAKFDTPTSAFDLLTQRECEVARLVNRGLKNKEVGERLFISETTVRHHLTTIFSKLEVRNRFELIDHLHRNKFLASKGGTFLPVNDAKESADQNRNR
jgi:DNA-binding NarL/FixJ family response regulator